MARLTALARRPTLGASQTLLKAGDLEMDLVARSVRRGGEAIDLQPREFRLLEFLMRAEGRLVTRTMLLEQVWEYHFDPKTNIVETHISQLRSKIDRGGPSLIQTLRGAGYSLRVPESSCLGPPASGWPSSIWRCSPPRRWRWALSSTCPFNARFSPISTSALSRRPAP
jgi:DNA-binding winged helix-turn-helix (wHTH) protein